MSEKKDYTLSEDVIALIVKAVLQQTGQQGTQTSGQLTVEQIEQIAQSVQGSTQEKSNVVDSVTQNKQEEINSGEAHRAATFTDRELWGFNKKLLASKEFEYDKALKSLEIKEKELAVAEREAKLRHQAKLDAIAVSEAQQGLNFRHAINFEYARFNNAVAEPISPDTGSDKKDAKK